MNPQPSDLESDALAVRATGLRLCLFMERMASAMPAVLLQLKLIGGVLLIFHARIVSVLTIRALQ